MTVWKSPVLYFGLVLLAAVLLALAAPLVMDWNAYRGDLETFGRKLTGRTVTIEGPISARLFPWPRLTLSDVHVANPPGFAGKELAAAERIDVKMQLGGLFSGTVQVESIAVEKPAVTLEVSEAGEGNWSLAPSPDVEGGNLLARVRLDQITLTDGTLRLLDRRRSGAVAIEQFDGSLSAPGLRGPWRLRAQGESGGTALDLSFNTGSWTPGEALRFGLRVAPAGGAGLVYSFDGKAEDGRTKGDLRIEPVADANGKSDSELQLRPFVLTARLDADFMAAAFDNIQVSPPEAKEGSTTVNGSARLSLGGAMKLDFALEAPRIDADEMAGPAARALIGNGDGMQLANAAVALLPQGLAVAGQLKVTSLQAAGQTYENIDARVSGDRDMLHVDRLRASLPGRTEVLLQKGVFIPGPGGGDIAGRLALESNDLRAFAGWRWPDGKAGLERLWTGSRGRLKLETDFEMKPSRLRLNGGRYELDGAPPGTIDLTVERGGRLAVNLAVAASLLDIDNLLADGVTAMPGAKSGGLGAALALLLPGEARADLRLDLKAGRLMLNGAEADDVAIDLASTAKGLQLNTVRIGSVGGATLGVSGLLLDEGAGLDGKVDGAVQADDPRGLLRLLGFIPADRDPAWTEALGSTVLNGTFKVTPKGDTPGASLEVSGTSGDLILTASAALAGGLSRDGLVLRNGSVDIRAGHGETLARLIGLQPAGGDATPGRLVLAGSGTLADGFQAQSQVQLFGVNFEYVGRFGSGWTPDGKVTLRGPDAAPLAAALGLPSAGRPSGAIELAGRFGGDASHPFTMDFTGAVGGAPLSGTLAADPAGKLDGSFRTGELALADVLSAVLLNWDGRAPDAGTPFAAGLPFGLTGEFWISPAGLRIGEGFTGREAQIGITATDGQVEVEAVASDGALGRASVGLTSTPATGGGGRAIAARLRLPVDLGRQLRAADGAAVAAGTGTLELDLSGSGRSPGGVLASLSGGGSYAFNDVSLLKLDPAALRNALAAATDAGAVAQAFDALHGNGDLGVGDAAGTIAVAGGVATFSPAAVATAYADVTLKATAELAEGALDLSVALKLLDNVARPPMEITYAGPPSALVRGEDKTELMSQLGGALMAKGVAELERLHQEQQRLAAAEDKARAEDEARLQDYYAQRDELLLRQRELRVHGVLRARAAEALRQLLESERATEAAVNRSELRQRIRELRVHRRLANAADLPDPVPPPKPRARPAPPVPQTDSGIDMQPLEISPSQQ